MELVSIATRKSNGKCRLRSSLLTEAQSLIFKGVKSQNDVLLNIGCFLSFLNFWSRQSSDLNIIICESFDVCCLPPPTHLITATSSAPTVGKGHLYKNCLFIKDHLRFSESARLNAWTGPLFVPQITFTFWEGEVGQAGRRRRWLPSHWSCRPAVPSEAEVWLRSWLSLGLDPRCSTCSPRWSFPWVGSRSCRSPGPCSQGGWRRAVASAGQRTPFRSSTGRCNTRVGRLQQQVDQHVGNSEIVMFQWMNGGN